MRRVLRACFTSAFALMFVACGEQPKETSVESPGSRPASLQLGPAAGEIPTWAKVAPDQIEAAKNAGVRVAFENSIGMRFVLIPAGTFPMGSPEEEKGRESLETQHRVTLTKPFYVSIYETTNGQFRRFRKYHDSHEQKESLNGDSQPVVNVSHTDAVDFATWMTGQENGRAYRLPTEAEWEYAARAKTTTSWYWGNDEDGFVRNANIEDARTIATFHRSSSSRWDDGYAVTAPVGTFLPNGWGLYDVIGNVWEWCADWKADYPTGTVADPTGPATGTSRVLRGGSWGGKPVDARAACRWGLTDAGTSGLGFRLAVSVSTAR